MATAQPFVKVMTMGEGDKSTTAAMQEEEQVHPEVLALTAASNPYLDLFNAYCTEHEGELITVFDPQIKEKKRAKMFGSLDVSAAMVSNAFISACGGDGSADMCKYSWAIPDERALQIIKHYGPIVEMGAGNGYWGKLLQLRGVDIVCYDLHVEGEDEEENSAEEQGEDGSTDKQDGETGDDDEEESPGADGDEIEASHEEEEGGESGEDGESDDDDDYVEEDEDEEVEVEQIYWAQVLKGTPKDLRKHSDRALFLCYPDDFEDSSASMALECLCNHSGDTVIHVGELFSQSVCLPGPWGRTSAKEFQEHLASVYHKVLQVPLPSWHTSIDTLTVWKRTQTSILGSAFYAFIPAEERLDLVEACDSTRHLLQLGQATDENEKKDRSKRQKRSAQPTLKQTMKSPKRSALAYLAEYQFGDDNLLTATFQEEQRLRNEARVRNAQPAIRLRDISLSDDDPVINNAKRAQQDQDRRDVITQHNMILLERLEKIHQHHVPKQFDVSHLSEEILNAPRASNASLRRREQQKIELENEKMHKRLQNAKGALSAISNRKQLALDADKHRYLAEQISKVARRRKVREWCQALVHEQHQKHPMMIPQMIPVQPTLQLFDQNDDRHYERGYEDDYEHNRLEVALSGSKSLSRLDRNKKPDGFAVAGETPNYAKLPHIHHKPADQHQHHDHHNGKKSVRSSVLAASPATHSTCSPTLTNTAKLISARDLTSAFRNAK